MSEIPKIFLCHSKTDAVAVARLRRRLQGYDIPAGLRREGRSRLGRFIPDRPGVVGEEEVKALLASAEWLVVCCTPASFASERVNAEIDLFIRVNAKARFLMVLLEGEPREVLPVRLRAREPLTTDFRPGADGRELGLLKLIAALLDLNLGALRDSQAARERGRGDAQSWAAGALALLAAAGAWISVTAMRERDAALAMASAAIDIGAELAAQTDDPAHSEEQFEHLFASGVRHPAFARRHAQLLLQFAEKYQNGARASAAIAAFEGLPEPERRSLDFVRALALMSRAEDEAGRESAAINYASRAVEAARALQQGGGGNERASLAAALGRLGALHMDAGRPSDAVPFLIESIPLLTEAHAEVPDQAANLFAALDLLGDAQVLTGDQAGARASFEQAASLARTRFDGARDSTALHAALGAALMKLGQAHRALGEAAGARAPLEESLVIARRLSADSTDTALQGQVSARLILVAQARAELGVANAELMDEAIGAARAQTQREPGSAEAKTVLADLLAANALRLERGRDYRAARAAWLGAAEVRRDLRRFATVAASTPAALADALEHVAQTSLRLDDRPGAQAAYGEALRMRRAVVAAQPQDRPARAALGDLLHAMGLMRTRADDGAGARRAFDEAARLRLALAEEDHGDEAMALQAADSLQHLARVQQAARSSEAARRSLESARDVLGRLSDPASPRTAAALRRTEAALQATPASSSN